MNILYLSQKFFILFDEEEFKEYLINIIHHSFSENIKISIAALSKFIFIIGCLHVAAFNKNYISKNQKIIENFVNILINRF